MPQLQTLLPYYDRFFGRRRVFGRQTIAFIRGRRRASATHRSGKAQDLIDYTDKIYLEFGADEHIEGLGNEQKVKEIRKKAIQAGLKLVDCPIRHLGTEKAHDLYLAIENYLRANGVDLIFGRQCDNIILDGDVCKGVYIEDSKGGNKEEIFADKTIIATGRRGADWLEKCVRNTISPMRPALSI